jgi:predicted cupin superfamily sugar epimerase
MLAVDQIIEKYQLQKHPEGGYFKEVYRDNISLNFGKKYDGEVRSLFTSIYFLLKEEEQSALHVIKNSSEIWYYHCGSPLQITVIDPITGIIEKTIIGNPVHGYQPQCIIPGDKWFGAECLDKKGYSFVSCMVAPGFDFRDFSLVTEDQLLNLIPHPPRDVLNLLQIHTDITVSDIIHGPIDKLWSIISDFNSLPAWHPAIEDSFIEYPKSNGDIGCVRNFNLINYGGNIREELMVLDNENYLMKYKILNSQMLLSNYIAILKLERVDEEKTKITWECHFDCHLKYKHILQTMIRDDVFKLGIEALKNQTQVKAIHYS